MRRWLDLSAYITCFYSQYFHSKRVNTITTPINNPTYYTCYSDPDLFTLLKSGVSSMSINCSYPPNNERDIQFGQYGECYYCCLLRSDDIKDKSDISIQKRFDIIDGYASSIFYIKLDREEKTLNDNHLTLNNDFFLKFNGLEIIDITNIPIDQMELNKRNKSSLKYLTYLSLDNNDLTNIQIDFQYLNKLVYLKLSKNPLEILPLNCLAGKYLQSIDLIELGRLTELDNNTKFSSELKTISLISTTLTTLPQTLGAENLTKLTKLIFNGVLWWGVDGMSVNEVVKYESFEKRFLPYLDQEELTSIYHMYDEDLNGILSFTEINAMNAHIYRYIPRLRATNNTKMV